jgi:large subunit ribosomal protein L25
MKSVALNAFPRSQTRRKGAKAVRANGRIPANIYGRHHPAQNLEVDAKEFDDLVHAAHSEIILVDLAVKEDPIPQRLALIQDVQHHALSGEVLHVDLHEVKADEKVTIHVPVEPVGEAVGVKTGGGVLEHVLFKIRVRALPKDLPEQINVDVSALEIGKSLHLGDLKPISGVEFLGEKTISIFAVAQPKTEEVETPAAAATAEGAEAKQPEMIKEKKDEGAPAGEAKAAEGDKGDKKAAEKKK